jgi:hypothetical protein
MLLRNLVAAKMAELLGALASSAHDAPPSSRTALLSALFALIPTLVKEQVARPEADPRCRLAAVSAIASIAGMVTEDTRNTTCVAALGVAVKPLVRDVCQWAARDVESGKGNGFRFKALVSTSLAALNKIMRVMPPSVWGPDWAEVGGTFWLSRLTEDTQVRILVQAESKYPVRRAIDLDLMTDDDTGMA